MHSFKFSEGRKLASRNQVWETGSAYGQEKSSGIVGSPHVSQLLDVDRDPHRRVRLFRNRVAIGIEPKKCLMPASALNSYIDYKNAARISATSCRGRVSLREAAFRLGFVTEERFDAWVRPGDMTHPLGVVR